MHMPIEIRLVRTKAITLLLRLAKQCRQTLSQPRIIENTVNVMLDCTQTTLKYTKIKTIS